METNFQKIQKLLSLSDLLAQEQNDFLILLSSAQDENLEPLATLFAEDPSWIYKINENYKLKRAAAAGKDKSAWAEILKKEETQLKELEP